MALSPLENLPNDVIRNIYSYFSLHEMLALNLISVRLAQVVIPVFFSLYNQVFGVINKTYQPKEKIVATLLYAEKRPKTLPTPKTPEKQLSQSSPNMHSIPSDYLERWKWLLGVENTLDKEVQELYNEKMQTLKETQATSIIQLKHQLQGFWYVERELQNYVQFKSEEKARATSGVINKFFFFCLGYVFKFCYNSLVLSSGQKLNELSRNTFAKIGGFNLGDKAYDVVACHPLSDELITFSSGSYGRTYIGIFEKGDESRSLSAFSHYGGPRHNFGVSIGRKGVNSDIIHEGHLYSGKVSGDCRLLMVEEALEYRDRTFEPHGSDRLLDQKLTQIMIETLMQNEEVLGMRVSSGHDDFPVLVAGGFNDYGRRSYAKQVRKQLKAFRKTEGNKLFPPYEDYNGVSTIFETSALTEKNVLFSGEAKESWNDIITRNPILEPNAGILPEYWTKEPNLA